MSSFTLIEDEVTENNGQARFTVFGVGGGGSNAVQHMVNAETTGVKFICANTDKQALDRSTIPNRVQLGPQITGGKGAGGKPEIGSSSAQETEEVIRKELEGSDMVFVTAGMGGGTGTGAAPVVAAIAQEMGILTVGIVTTPFHFEGGRRMKSAEKGIEELEKHVDSLIIIPNEKLLKVYGSIAMKEAFKKADDVLLIAVRSIFGVVLNEDGYTNTDFADLRTVMSNRGYAMMGIGAGRGDERARQAAEQAIRSPLLDDVCLQNAKGLLVHITLPEDAKTDETNEVAAIINQIANTDEGDVIYGWSFSSDNRDELRVTVVATGLTRDPVDFTNPSARPAQKAASVTSFNQPISTVAGNMQPQQQEDDEAPAISRRPTTVSPVAPAQPAQPASTPRPSPMSIQDYLKNQQKK